MGKGDKRTRRGKIWRNTFGRLRRKLRAKGGRTSTPKRG